ncbi:hypothetical protein Tco_0389288 [Tanacetum coccineum]
MSGFPSKEKLRICDFSHISNVEWDELIHIEMVETIVEAEDCFEDKVRKESTRILSAPKLEVDLPVEYIPVDATWQDLYVGREEVSPYTIYTFNDVRKEAYN